MRFVYAIRYEFFNLIYAHCRLNIHTNDNAYSIAGIKCHLSSHTFNIGCLSLRYSLVLFISQTFACSMLTVNISMFMCVVCVVCVVCSLWCACVRACVRMWCVHAFVCAFVHAFMSVLVISVSYPSNIHAGLHASSCNFVRACVRTCVRTCV